MDCTFVNTNFFAGRPVFKIKPQDQTVQENDMNVTFKCSATSNPMPSYTWFKDNIVINKINFTNIVLSKDNQNITILTVQRKDAGLYVCNATNKIGSVTASAHLNVQCKYTFSNNHLFICLFNHLFICQSFIYN